VEKGRKELTAENAESAEGILSPAAFFILRNYLMHTFFQMLGSTDYFK